MMMEKLAYMAKSCTFNSDILDILEGLPTEIEHDESPDYKIRHYSLNTLKNSIESSGLDEGYTDEYAEDWRAFVEFLLEKQYSHLIVTYGL